VRALTPTLLEAQKQPSAQPYVRVTVSDRIVALTRLRWERLYTGGETDRYHAAAMPGDGSLLRARVEPSTSTIAYQRVANPGAGSAFGSWSTLDSVANAGLALAASGANALLAFVPLNGVQVRIRESSDYGASFGTVQIVAGAGAFIGSVAAVLKPDGTAFLIYAAGSTVFVLKRTGGTWGSAVAWPYSASQITGLACWHSGDYLLAIAGVDGSGAARLWAAVYGDGATQAVDTWSVLRDVAQADAGSNVTFRAPSLAVLDTYRLFFVESYSGSVAYDRPQWTWFAPSQSFAANAWREPVPFDLNTAYGLALTGADALGPAWLSMPSGVWRAPLTTAELDLSDDVLELSSELRRDGGRARVVLRNDHGRYTGLSTGAGAVIRAGAELEFGAGYVTSAGPEAPAAAPRFVIGGWEHRSGDGEATVTLFARDAWSLVERWRARRQFAWAAGTDNLFQILRFVFGRAGIDLINTGSSALASALRPAFTIHPGQDGRRVVAALLSLTADVVLVSALGASYYEPVAGATTYRYGGDHAITRARFASAGRAVNRAQVFGPSVVAESFAWDDIGDQFDRLRQAHDLNVTTVALAQDRAAALLRREELSPELGELVSPVNCGQELYDIVAVTDEGAGLSDASFRVVGIDLRFGRRGRPTYEQRLLLGSV